MQFENLTSLYQYFDQLAEHDADADILFASSYIRGFISLAASEFGGEEQPLSSELAQRVTDNLYQARTELTPQDKMIVNDYWHTVSNSFNPV